MFGESSGYISAEPDQTSEKYNAMIDRQVKEILDVRKYWYSFFIEFILKSVKTVKFKRKRIKRSIKEFVLA
jgi:hypothetical protein